MLPEEDVSPDLCGDIGSSTITSKETYSPVLLCPPLPCCHVQDNQTSLRNLSAHNAALDLLRCPLPHDATPDNVLAIHGIFRLCHELLQAFCLRNPANQDALFAHLPLFTEQLALDVGAEDTITVLMLENRRLCTNVSDDVFWELAAQVLLRTTAVVDVVAVDGSSFFVIAVPMYRQQIERSGRRPSLLRPFVSLMRCGDVPIKKNQTRTLQVLIQPSLTQPMLLYNLPEQKAVRTEIIKVRGAAEQAYGKSELKEH